MDEIINWVQELRNDNKIDFAACLQIDHTSGIPPRYGINSVEGILDKIATGYLEALHIMTKWTFSMTLPWKDRIIPSKYRIEKK